MHKQKSHIGCCCNQWRRMIITSWNGKTGLAKQKNTNKTVFFLLLHVPQLFSFHCYYAPPTPPVTKCLCTFLFKSRHAYRYGSSVLFCSRKLLKSTEHSGNTGSISKFWIFCDFMHPHLKKWEKKKIRTICNRVLCESQACLNLWLENRLQHERHFQMFRKEYTKTWPFIVWQGRQLLCTVSSLQQPTF